MIMRKMLKKILMKIELEVRFNKWFLLLFFFKLYICCVILYLLFKNMILYV